MATTAFDAVRDLFLLKQAAPRTRRIAVLFNPEFGSSGYLVAIEAAAATSNVKALKTPVRNSEDIKARDRRRRQRVECRVAGGAPFPCLR
jgi:ABC-type uncharacterized transport system substrate-binding protein